MKSTDGPLHLASPGKGLVATGDIDERASADLSLPKRRLFKTEKKIKKAKFFCHSEQNVAEPGLPFAVTLMKKYVP
jgi:hypothetical protein